MPLEINPNVMSNDSRSFQAGQLVHYYEKWMERGAPQVILKIIKGYRIPFVTKPPLSFPNVNSLIHTQVSEEMTAVVQKMKLQGILKPVPIISPSFISHMFLIPKADGSQRPIFNLKVLNEFVRAEPFRLINMYRVPQFLQADDWLCKIDLSQAYFHLKVAEVHQRFLRLIYKGELLEMTCLPFGLSTAPKTFSMLTNWIAQTLRQENVRILVYLDDYLIAHQNPIILREHVQMTLNVLQTLGWCVNFEKSITIPQKSITYLGVLWRTWDNLKSLPEEKVTTTVTKIHQVLNQRQVTLSDIQSLVGLLNFASFVVPRGRLHHRHLLRFMNALLKRPTNKAVLPQVVQTELKWWIQNCHRSTLLHFPPPSHFLTTDASDLGWGAQLDNVPLTGSWSPKEQILHCNQKEMLAILHVVQLKAHKLSRSSLLIQCDNKTVVAHLRKEGGTKSLALMDITHKLLTLLDRHQILFTIHYIPGRYNNHADHLSRHRRPPEWHLIPECLETIFAKWGTPVIDLFASERAHVVHNYVTLDQRDHRALFYDAFSVPWNYPLAWVFPPPFLVPKVLSHLNQSTGIFLIVVPRWQKVFWRADLRARALAAPFVLKNLTVNLIDMSTGLPPPNIEDLTLEVWKCGGGRRK